MPANSSPDTYTEWQVTGQSTDPALHGMPPYASVWSPLSTQHLGRTDDDIERAAREFAELAAARGSLTDVTLSQRTVTVAPWVVADVFPGRDDVLMAYAAPERVQLAENDDTDDAGAR